METDWINVVIGLNARIAAAEVCFNAQVIALVETSDQGQDTSEAERLLVSHRRNLVLLRAVQAHLLQAPEAKA